MVAKRSRLDFSTAYGQLILLVLIPISALATVGGLLVWQSTNHAAQTIQRATADSLLDRYVIILNSRRTSLEQINQVFVSQRNQSTPITSLNIDPTDFAEMQDQLLDSLEQVSDDKHLHGVAIVNEYGQILANSGDITGLKEQLPKLIAKSRTLTKKRPHVPFGDSTELFDNDNNPEVTNQNSHAQLLTFDNQVTLFGKKIEFSDNSAKPSSTMWVFINVDNEPLQIARYQIIIALAITGLLTILLLLLTLNVYARRWIAPIYELRLHLQRTNANNLYKPMTIESSGEIHQLQQDLVKTLRRLHSAFQELKNHAEQTEDDLRLAFDEMEMQNISIRNARDAAISASETKSAFLANISHELRTPLNSIDGFINLLSRHGGLSAEQDLYVQTIRKSSAHLLALVNDVLDFSKIEAGKLVLDSHEFDLYASIYDVVDMLSPLAAEKGLRLAVIFYDDVPRHLIGDALRVKQVLTNLVNNAIKFTDVGDVVVRASLDDDDDFINISVQDTGRGVSVEHQQLLFQSFSQGDPSITRQYGGTGLGLVISKQLTFMMGGEIGFFDNADNLINGDNSTALTGFQDNPKNLNEKSSKTKGSTFWFTLPMRLSNAEEQRLLTHEPIWQPPKSLTRQYYRDTVSTISMLVWIDHTATLQVLKGSLRQLPIEISLVQSLAGLLEKLKETGNRWDWVIVDNHDSEDTPALLKQIRLHYAGKLALFGYQINVEPELLSRYQARALYQPLDRRQLYRLLSNDSYQQQQPSLPQWHGFRVLAVDDHPPNLLVLEALLAELGITVISVNSGFEAVDYIRNQQAENAVDLIFMDIQMPRMSGSEAAIQIRQIEAQAAIPVHIPIVALTAHSLSDEREKLLASGIDDYVGKPISQSQLSQILQRWLGNQSETTHHWLASLATNPPDKIVDTLTNSNLANPTNTVYSVTPAFATAERPDIDQKSLAVIDWEDALNRVAGKADLAVNLLIMLIDSIDQEKADLHKAWQRHDRKELSHIAHRILGASRYTGVPQLRQASQNLEDKCLLNVGNNSPAQFAMLSSYYDALCTAFDNLKHANLSAFPELQQAWLNKKVL